MKEEEKGRGRSHIGREKESNVKLREGDLGLCWILEFSVANRQLLKRVKLREGSSLFKIRRDPGQNPLERELKRKINRRPQYPEKKQAITKSI